MNKVETKDVERFAFLYLCGTKDRNILTGKEKMRFSDFYRLTYITDFLGLSCFNIFLWNEYAHQFRAGLSALDELVQEYGGDLLLDEDEEGIDQQDLWIQEFCSNAPNHKVRKELKEIIEQIYLEMSIEE